MGVIANIQGIVIVNRSPAWISYTDCSVTSVEHVCLYAAYIFIHASVNFCYCNINRFVLLLTT